ncbi:MAG: hypothetical protein ACJAT3_000617 [Akkermansiaceae bacterium]|jgi:hypothetical protein
MLTIPRLTDKPLLTSLKKLFRIYVSLRYSDAMKATLLSLVSLAPIAFFVSCGPNQGQDGTPVAPPATLENIYGVPDAVLYQPIDPVNPLAVPIAPNYNSPDPAIPAIPAPSTLNGNVHTIKKGDSLWGISRKYGTSVEALKTINGMSNDTIIEGHTLVIPGR